MFFIEFTGEKSNAIVFGLNATLAEFYCRQSGFIITVIKEAKHLKCTKGADHDTAH